MRRQLLLAVLGIGVLADRESIEHEILLRRGKLQVASNVATTAITTPTTTPTPPVVQRCAMFRAIIFHYHRNNNNDRCRNKWYHNNWCTNTNWWR